MTKRERNRRSIRLEGFDYRTPGAYFVTILCWRRRHLFGSISEGGVELSEVGEIAKKQWIRTFKIRAEVEIDQYIVMPNHFHAILWIVETVVARSRVRAHCNAPLHRPSGSLGSVVSGFKAAVTRKARVAKSDPELQVWQRNYYDRIIRDEAELNLLRRYIRDNPRRWKLDQYFIEA